jgi:hypothetical protein
MMGSPFAARAGELSTQLPLLCCQRGAPEEVRRWTRVARCADPHGGKATWAKVRLEAPGADRKPVELMALAAVVDETYTAYFRVV